jgi:hypothetical protein
MNPPKYLYSLMQSCVNAEQFKALSHFDRRQTLAALLVELQGEPAEAPAIRLAATPFSAIFADLLDAFGNREIPTAARCGIVAEHQP